MNRFLIATLLGLLFFHLLALAIIFSGAQAPQPCVGSQDTLLILGKRVLSDSPDQDFSLRIQRLDGLLAESTERNAIASGSARSGKISEAAFVAQALPNYNIALEQQARSTRENIRNSLPLAPADTSIAVITNRYHLARTAVIARQKGLSLTLIPAEDVWEWSWSNIVSLGRETMLYWPTRLGW